MIRTRAPTQILDQYTSKSLGLVGDGVFDNSARLQAGIEYVADRGGGVIKLDVGTYRVDSIQTLLRDGVHIEGFSADLTILDFSQRTSAYANQGSLLLSGDGGLSNTVSVTSDVIAGAVSIPVDDISGFLACSLGLVSIGGPLSDAQETAHYDAVQAWATAVGANV